MSKLSARSAVYRAATSVSGHRPPFAASTAHSSRTSPLNAAAQPNRRRPAATGIATMQATKNSQTVVCRSLIPTSISRTPAKTSVLRWPSQPPSRVAPIDYTSPYERSSTRIDQGPQNQRHHHGNRLERRPPEHLHLRLSAGRLPLRPLQRGARENPSPPRPTLRP